MAELGQYIPVSKAKNRLLSLIRELEQHQETIEILADQKTMRSLRRSLKQAERGEWLPHSEVFDKESS